MATSSYGIQEFAHEMEDVLRSQPGQAKIFDRGSSFLERLIGNSEALPPEYRVPSGTGPRSNHGSYLLYRGDSGLLVTAVVWGPGDHAAPHDHHTWGMIGVINNALSETRFRRLDDRQDPRHAALERDREATLLPGEISLLTPTVDEIHQMDNYTDRPTVEIHVYGQDLKGLDRCRYNLETGEVTPFVTRKWDNE